MIYKLAKDKYGINVVVYGLCAEDEEKLSNQLSPFIVKSNNNSTHKIIVTEGIQNYFTLYDNVLYVTYINKNYMFKVVRQAIRDIIYYNYLESGYIKIHGASVRKNDDTYVIIGPNGVGKTSLALGLCEYCNYSLIDGDLVLINGLQILGWQTAIGLRKETAKILNFNYNEGSELTWYWPINLLDKGYNFSYDGKLKKIIYPKFDFKINTPDFRIIEGKNKRDIIINNIHYSEINKENYWNKPNIDINSMKEKFIKNSDIMDVTMIEYASNGLNSDNIKKLDKILRRR